jgi:hypothetical protein
MIMRMIMLMIIKYSYTTPNFTTATCIVIQSRAVVVLLFIDCMLIEISATRQQFSSTVGYIDGLQYQQCPRRKTTSLLQNPNRYFKQTHLPHYSFCNNINALNLFEKS